MEENNSFKNKAMSHIPLELQQSMLREVNVPTDGLSPLEAIARATASTSPLPQKAEVPQQEQFIMVAIDNVAVKVSTDPYKAMQTLFAFLLATVWSKDKKIAKVLKAFNFSLQDANNRVIYPLKKGKKK